MTDTPFHQTRRGHRFYEVTMPTLVQELTRLNEMLARLLEERGRPSLATGAEPSGRKRR